MLLRARACLGLCHFAFVLNDDNFFGLCRSGSCAMADTSSGNTNHEVGEFSCDLTLVSKSSDGGRIEGPPILMNLLFWNIQTTT